ncbi:hypothetical protein WJ45_19990 [Burkholderia ubonensis]|nr:hypothetical protein WJ45_19990 [Burkholderia ubonensis]
MIILTGPAGVGKSVACESLVQNLIKAHFQQFPDDTQTIPAIMVEAAGPRTDRFDWCELDRAILQALQIPMIDATLPMVTRTIDGRLVDVPLVESRSHPTSRSLRARFRLALDQRNPVALVIDEASNILTSPKPADVKRQANVLKTIINTSKTRLILTGAYDLYELATKSGQLARRSPIIHFEPYCRDNLEGFTKAVLTFQQYLPFDEPFCLEPHIPELFLQSLGCVGLLKNILDEAVDLAISEGKKNITVSMLRRGYYRPQQLATFKHEIFDGYRLIEGSDYPDLSLFVDGHPSTKTSSRRHRPGVRAATRDSA